MLYPCEITVPLLLSIFCPEAPLFKIVFPISTTADPLPVRALAIPPPCNGHVFPASVLLLRNTDAG